MKGYLKLFVLLLSMATIMILIIGVCAHHSNVYVNLPADALPLQQIPSPKVKDVVLLSDRAILWWTVYSKTLECNHNAYIARDCADEAVTKVYGRNL